MKAGMMKCIRCKGRKKIFKVNNGYSYTNTGGVEVNCPMCLGNGEVKSLDDALVLECVSNKDLETIVKKEYEKNKKSEVKNKDIHNAKESTDK